MATKPKEKELIDLVGKFVHDMTTHGTNYTTMTKKDLDELMGRIDNALAEAYRDGYEEAQNKAYWGYWG